MACCLIVEDDQRHRKILAATLRTAGHQVLSAATGEQGLELCRHHLPELVLLDLGLPDVEGLELLPRLLGASPLSRVVVLTGLDCVTAAVRALRAGARHYLVKPWERAELLLVVEREARAVDLQELRARTESRDLFWGGHAKMAELRRILAKLATSPLTSVLIEGQTGTGKEMVARELHRLSRPRGQFVTLNCAAVPSELLESELFGHERGAFTGAQSRRRGVVELARDGTLLLDEIGEMRPSLQSKLLRFLQDQRYRRVGGEQEHQAGSRVIATTHRDVEALVERGRFREDLFYRLAVVRLELPSLHQRRQDLLPLASFLLQSTARDLGRAVRQLSPAAESALLEHPWPGNVRELRNRLERALVLGGDGQIQPRDLDLPARRDSPQEPAVDLGPARLREVLDEEEWNISRAARRLGIERHRLRYRLRKYQLRRPEACS